MSDQQGGPVPGLLAGLRADLGAAACSIALVDGVELVFVAAVGAGADQVVGMRIPLGRGIAGSAVVSGQPIAVADVRRDARFDRTTAESTGYVPSTVLAVPVDGEDVAIGVLEVLDRTVAAGDLDRVAVVAEELAAHYAGATAVPAAAVDAVAVSQLVALAERFADRSPATRERARTALVELLDDWDPA